MIANQQKAMNQINANILKVIEKGCKDEECDHKDCKDKAKALGAKSSNISCLDTMYESVRQVGTNRMTTWQENGSAQVQVASPLPIESTFKPMVSPLVTPQVFDQNAPAPPLPQPSYLPLPIHHAPTSYPNIRS